LNVVIETGIVVGYVIAWAVRKARRVGGQLDAEVDQTLDAGLERLHELVTSKLAGDPALRELQDEAADGQVTDLTRQRIELSVQAAVAKDEAFAKATAQLLEAVETARRSAGPVALGPGAAAVAGDVDIHAESGSAAAWSMGNVQLGSPPPDPPSPGRRTA
jgi:hypothetical protein